MARNPKAKAETVPTLDAAPDQDISTSIQTDAPKPAAPVASVSVEETTRGAKTIELPSGNLRQDN